MYSDLFESVRLIRRLGTPVLIVVWPAAGDAPPERPLPWNCRPALPWKLLVPLLVMTLITPPVAPPNSAV